jgi:hypothetical protein
MTVGDLVQLAAVKSWCGVTTTNDDALLAALITQISRGIYNYLNRSFVLPTNVVENYDGNGRQQLLLRNWPVGAIASLTIDGQPIPPAPPLVANSPPQPGFVLEASDDQPPGAMQQLFLRGDYRFQKGRQNVLVAYRAGYEVVGETQVVPTSAPYQLTALAPFGQWAQDTGVAYADGATLTPVASPGAAGQYAVNAATGTYSFAAADAGQPVTLSYGYIPADLEQCALEWVADRYRYKDRIGIASKSLGGQETTAYQNKSVPDFVAMALTNFRRIIAN